MPKHRRKARNVSGLAGIPGVAGIKRGSCKTVRGSLKVCRNKKGHLITVPRQTQGPAGASSVVRVRTKYGTRCVRLMLVTKNGKTWKAPQFMPNGTCATKGRVYSWGNLFPKKRGGKGKKKGRRK
jgi:hypothetical protein